MVYAWQQDQWQRLAEAKAAQRLPHALLFAGLPGTGKTQFAEDFTRALLCTNLQAQQMPCDACHACRQILNKAHPNVLRIEPEKAGQAIKVDQIREVSDFVNQSSLQGEYRVVIINPAADMNMNAANALLKTLEEPSSGALLVLICEQTSALPATILSRCQHFHFVCPDTQQAMQWLEAELKDKTQEAKLLLRLANGAPLAALKLANENTLELRQTLYQALLALSQKQADPIKTAAALQELETTQFLDFMLTWVMDILRLQLGGDVADITNIDYVNSLTDIQAKTTPTANSKFMQQLQKTRVQINAGINLNKTIVLEAALINWVGGLI